MIALAVDASTYRGTVAVLRDSEVIAVGEAAMRGATDERLMPAVADALARSSIGISAVDAVICGAGPGSFTSLRIAAGTAKGIASARGLPLFALPSLGLAVASVSREAGRYCVVADALRGDRFAAVYDVDESGVVVELEPARVLAASDADAFARTHGARLLAVSASGDATFVQPHAAGAARMRSWIDRSGEVDVAAWQPVYGRLAEAQVKWEVAHGRPLAGA